jgi:hypothetical protein
MMDAKAAAIGVPETAEWSARRLLERMRVLSEEALRALAEGETERMLPALDEQAALRPLAEVALREVVAADAGEPGRPGPRLAAVLLVALQLQAADERLRRALTVHRQQASRELDQIDRDTAALSAYGGGEDAARHRIDLRR